MFDYDGMRTIVATGLKNYLGCPVVRSNQNKKPPKYPFISYTVTQPMGENKGTYGKHKDGVDRKAFPQTWSISALSADETESVNLAIKAREWLDHVGTVYLSDNGVDVQSVGAVTNRDNVLTVEYEYKKGFDVVFLITDEVENPDVQAGYIETVEFDGVKVQSRPSENELNKRLQDRLTGR